MARAWGPSPKPHRRRIPLSPGVNARRRACGAACMIDAKQIFGRSDRRYRSDLSDLASAGGRAALGTEREEPGLARDLGSQRCGTLGRPRACASVGKFSTRGSRSGRTGVAQLFTQLISNFCCAAAGDGDSSAPIAQSDRARAAAGRAADIRSLIFSSLSDRPGERYESARSFLDVEGHVGGLSSGISALKAGESKYPAALSRLSQAIKRFRQRSLQRHHPAARPGRPGTVSGSRGQIMPPIAPDPTPATSRQSTKPDFQKKWRGDRLGLHSQSGNQVMLRVRSIGRGTRTGPARY